MSHLVFVYGTLQVGLPHHNKLENSDSRFIGSAITDRKFRLVIVEPRNSVCLINSPVNTVEGEVFEVGDVTLERLDTLERVSEQDGYQRKQTRAYINHGNYTVQVWVYLKPEGMIDEGTIVCDNLQKYVQQLPYTPRS